ncbi:uncharacterized protein ARMOST_21796 [Armillaria ostoyae]|uniref:Uncharacterized protein n=1 Tax=Armillaria ostoyae TaxID=47428 RepID=A0A284SB37_ARMOS|nr:uncharacterized protein ARMOST_21796 [Armillaria ostoyae]
MYMSHVPQSYPSGNQTIEPYTLAKPILIPFGDYFQVKDNFLDFSGTPEQIGIYILHNKSFTTTFVVALSLQSEAAASVTVSPPPSYPAASFTFFLRFLLLSNQLFLLWATSSASHIPSTPYVALHLYQFSVLIDNMPDSSLVPWKRQRARASCNPTHLRTIVDASPDLAIYSDHQSIRLTLFSVNSPLEETCTPDDLFQSLPTNLRHLSWTSYEASPTPTMPLFSVLHNLTFLELHFHAPMHSSVLTSPPPVSPTQMFYLPQLQTLKISLCSNTFELLSTWTLPSLCNLSLISPDFNYSSPGFLAFFFAHGAKIKQLELGHSSSNILEEHHITPTCPVIGRPSLSSLLPNMTEFVCSADVEWNWESADWIGPHVLLPSHPRL